MTLSRPHFGLFPRRLRLTPVWLAVLCGLLAGCPRSADKGGASDPVARRGSFSEVEAETSERPERSLDISSLQNMSELLAGMVPGVEPSGADTTEAPTLDPVWLEHARVMDEIWQGIAPRNESMRSWAKDTMAQFPTADAPLVYPFGGPDLVTAMNLFPDAKSYILVGLEAPGRLPLPEEFSSGALADDLKMLRSTFDSMVQSGYFVRTQIEQGVNDSEFDGVLPILLICLVRGGQLPLAVDYMGFDRQTKEIQPLAADETEASAVRILFHPRGDALGSARAVYYFAQDLSNRGLLSDDPFAEMLRRQGALNVYMKAAEYLMHTSEFLQFRKILLHEAQAILEDDSGIPIRHFTSDRWLLHLYGRYTDVLAAYKPFYQEDLASTFTKRSEGPLPFRIGYNATGDGGGLILALRKPEIAETKHTAVPDGG